MHMPMFKKLADGYLSTAGQFLTKAEKALIAFSGKLITFEIGILFLTDFLSGDTYFRIHRPAHNLDRCRTQFKLVESIERQEEAMKKYVERRLGQKEEEIQGPKSEDRRKEGDLSCTTSLPVRREREAWTPGWAR